MIITTSKGVVSYRHQRIYLDGAEIGEYHFDRSPRAYVVIVNGRKHRLDRLGAGVKYLLEAK